VLALRRDDVGHDHYRAPTLLPVDGAGISIAVMFTKDADVFLRAGALLLVGVAFWLVNLAALRGRGRFATQDVPGAEGPEPRPGGRTPSSS
jgi:hypothetical protein